MVQNLLSQVLLVLLHGVLQLLDVVLSLLHVFVAVLSCIINVVLQGVFLTGEERKQMRGSSDGHVEVKERSVVLSGPDLPFQSVQVSFEPLNEALRVQDLPLDVAQFLLALSNTRDHVVHLKVENGTRDIYSYRC